MSIVLLNRKQDLITLHFTKFSEAEVWLKAEVGGKLVTGRGGMWFLIPDPVPLLATNFSVQVSLLPHELL